MERWARLVHCGLVACSFAVAYSQPTYSLKRGLGGVLAEYEEKQIKGWPRILEGSPGTVVYIDYQFSDVRVWISARNEIGLPRLIEAVRTTLRLSGLSTERLGTWEGTQTCVIMFEARNVVKRSGLSSIAELDTSRFTAAIQESGFELPVGVIVGTTSRELTAITRGNEPIVDLHWLGSEVLSGESLRIERKLTWWRVAVGLAMYLLIAMSLIMVVLSPWSRWKARFEEQSLPPSSQEAQAAYDRTRSTSIGWLFLAIIPFAFVLALVPASIEETFLFTNWPTSPMAPIGLFVGTAIAYCGSGVFAKRHYSRRLGARVDQSGLPESEWDRSHRSIPAFMAGAFVTFLHLGLVFGVSELPRKVLVELGRFAFVALLVSGPVLGFAIGIFVYVRLGRRLFAGLKPGDQWHDEVMSLAARAGVRVRGVDVQNRSRANASATIGARVRLTSGLLAKLEVEEVRTIVAHELGHIYGRHALKRLVLIIPLFVCMLMVKPLILDAMETQLSLSFGVVGAIGFGVTMVLMLLAMIVVVRVSQRHEDAADRFSFDLIGDLDAIEAALTKVHALAGAPPVLKPEDEKHLTHPGLSTRIERLRRYAASKSARS